MPVIEGPFSQLAWQDGEKLLVYGIGNDSRQDDALGVRLIEKLEKAGVSDRVRLEANYQLNIEDALLLAEQDLVLFVDASKETEAAAPFSVRPIKPSRDIAFSTHALSMDNVLALCDELYGKKPRAFLLSLPGYEWAITDRMTEPARKNLETAAQALLEALPCTKSPS